MTLPIRYGKSVLMQEFIITDGISEECILGWDAIRKHGFTIDGETNSIYLAKETLGQAHFRAPDISIILHKRHVICRRTAVVVEARTNGSFPYVSPLATFMFTPSEKLPDGIRIQHFLGEVSDNGKYKIIIENQSHQDICLPRTFKLGTIEVACNVVGQITCSSTGDENTEEEKLDLTTTLSEVAPQYRKIVSKIIQDYNNLFAKKNSQLGCTDLVRHSIDTQGRGPIRQRPYRHPRRHAIALQRQLMELKKAGIIIESTSAWAAPVVLVEKKNGELRICIDYRKLNSITKKDSFPMPRIDETLDKLHGKQFFTTLDLASGYYQIELDDDAKEKTAFVVENNLYHFTRMPFGVCNGPPTFQRLMNYVLRDVLGTKALVYLDDVIIFSDTLEDHEKDIREVFELIRQAKLKLKLEKCQFMQKSVNYLGHVITPEGIHPDPAKIEKIVNYKVPTSADEVRSFLGLIGYYRRFVPNFGSIAKPLTLKTHKDLAKKKFIWTEADQKAFEDLRNRLITPPILAYPDFEQKFLLFTDACDYGIGAVLSQVQNGKEHPIAYASRQLKDAETRYHTTEKEALAIVYAIEHFKHYLQDKPFEVITDHAALQWLKNQKDGKGRLGRWAIALAGVPYEIKYRPGRVHQNADCLSRLKISNINCIEKLEMPEKIKFISEKQN